MVCGKLYVPACMGKRSQQSSIQFYDWDLHMSQCTSVCEWAVPAQGSCQLSALSHHKLDQSDNPSVVLLFLVSASRHLWHAL